MTIFLNIISIFKGRYCCFCNGRHLAWYLSSLMPCQTAQNLHILLDVLLPIDVYAEKQLIYIYTHTYV